jgi:hypothetical protein
MINRSSTTFVSRSSGLTASYEQLEQLGISCFMIRGADRQLVAEVGRKLNLDGTYIKKTFIEMYQERFRPAAAAVPIPGLPLSDPGSFINSSPVPAPVAPVAAAAAVAAPSASGDAAPAAAAPAAAAAASKGKSVGAVGGQARGAKAAKPVAKL